MDQLGPRQGVVIRADNHLGRPPKTIWYPLGTRVRLAAGNSRLIVAFVELPLAGSKEVVRSAVPTCSKEVVRSTVPTCSERVTRSSVVTELSRSYVLQFQGSFIRCSSLPAGTSSF